MEFYGDDATTTTILVVIVDDRIDEGANNG